MKKICYALFLTLGIFLLYIQQSLGQEVEMADELRSSGKIYIVVGVISIIFIGLAIYLFRLDRKISNIEKEIEKK